MPQNIKFRKQTTKWEAKCIGNDFWPNGDNFEKLEDNKESEESDQGVEVSAL